MICTFARILLAGACLAPALLKEASAETSPVELRAKNLRIDCLGGRGHKLRSVPTSKPNLWFGYYLLTGSQAEAALEIRRWRDGGQGVDDIEGEVIAIEWKLPEQPSASYPMVVRRIMFASLDMRERVRAEDWKLDSTKSQLSVSSASGSFFVHGTLVVRHPAINGGMPTPKAVFCALPQP